ncbi:MAG: hypothetical protein WAX04_06310 [Oscillospiraceae bacterium]
MISLYSDQKNIFIPSIFSFCDEPDKTVEVFDYLKNESGQIITLDFTKCEYADTGALVLLNIFIKNLKHKTNAILNEKSDINDLILVTGLNKRFNSSNLTLKNNLIKPLKIYMSPGSSKVATDMTSYFHKCYADIGLDLNNMGLQRISCMIAEIADNCRNHGKSSWYGYAFFRNYDTASECQFVFYNAGTTISDNIISLDMESELAQTLELKSAKLKGYKKETLWTLYAIQQGVSSMREPFRGIGTVEYIESFLELANFIHNQHSLMSITSGHVSILIDGSYSFIQSKELFDDNLGSKVIAFNNENSLNKQPDLRVIRNLNTYFPGTVVSVRLILKDEYFI